MKPCTNQRWMLLLATIILAGFGTSASAQEQTKRFALTNLTTHEHFAFNSLFATNFNLLTADDSPKPDFSGIEEWYEVVKYEYDFVDTLPKFILVVKKKVENAPLHFEIKWFDADGVVITKSVFPNLLTKASIPVGEPIRLYAYAPYERQMPKVKSVVVKKTSGQLNAP